MACRTADGRADSFVGCVGPPRLRAPLIPGAHGAPYGAAHDPRNRFKQQELRRLAQALPPSLQQPQLRHGVRRLSPPQAEQGAKLPVLYWLSGLTCTDENFMQKAGAQRMAAELGLIIIAPDTSPRGEGVADDANGAYDFGLGAGFYVNATQEPFASHYRMYDYVVQELPALIEANFPVSDKRGIAGHSMGGHGALICALKNPGRYQSVSAFSPISNPMNCPWGRRRSRCTSARSVRAGVSGMPAC